MKKRISILLVALLAVGCLGACAGSKPGDHSAPVVTVAQKVVSADSTLPDMVTDTSEGENAELNFSGFCDMDYRRAYAYSRSYAKEGTADEVIIVCAQSDSDVTAVINALKSYVKKRTGTMQEYMPAEVSKLDNAVYCSVGCYVGLFIGEKSGLNKNNFVQELATYGIQ